MTNRKNLVWLNALLIAVSMLMMAGVASAKSAQSEQQRPVYLDIRAVANSDENPNLSDSQIMQMVREKLSAMGRSSTVMNSRDELPVGVDVLRILYIVQQQPHKDEIKLAASASVQLLRADDLDGDGIVQTYSLYDGLQQISVLEKDEQKARMRVRDAFERQLNARISAALLAHSSF